MNKLLCLTLIFTACGQKQPIPNNTESDTIKKTPDKVEIFSDTLNEAKEIFSEPVPLNEIKQLNFLETTSGVAVISETKIFCKPSEAGFFGFYYMFNKTKQPWDYIGILKVHTTDKPEKWRFDTKNEIFVEIELENTDISVWDSIKVGVSEGGLMKFIGDNFHYKKGTIVYAELGDFKANFTIADDKISKLKVGRYCK
ncbi:MAG: hypothetical protein ACHQNT_12755 [Bacteroidia bacterium]